MSERRQPGDWVRLGPGVGFVMESDRLRAEIQPETDPDPCMLDCGDPKCREWATLWTAPDPQHGDKRHALYHVSECQMRPVGALDHYRTLQHELARVRSLAGEDSEAEDELLDAMDEAWWRLTPDEIVEINKDDANVGVPPIHG